MIKSNNNKHVYRVIDFHNKSQGTPSGFGSEPVTSTTLAENSVSTNMICSGLICTKSAIGNVYSLHLALIAVLSGIIINDCQLRLFQY